MKQILRAFLFLLLFTATVNTAIADEKANVTKQGTVRGRIIDATKQTLPGASIYIEKLHTGVTSDVNGFYTFSNLDPGTYTCLLYTSAVCLLTRLKCHHSLGSGWNPASFITCRSTFFRLPCSIHRWRIHQRSGQHHRSDGRRSRLRRQPDLLLQQRHRRLFRSRHRRHRYLQSVPRGTVVL